MTKIIGHVIGTDKGELPRTFLKSIQKVSDEKVNNEEIKISLLL